VALSLADASLRASQSLAPPKVAKNFPRIPPANRENESPFGVVSSDEELNHGA
jgi:hypothetical protein